MEKKNSDMLLEVGRKLCSYGKNAFRIGLPLFFVILFIFIVMHFAFGGGFDTFLYAMVFDIGMLAGLQAIVVIGLYVLFIWVVIGLPLYLFGWHLTGLGQIAKNTDKD